MSKIRSVRIDDAEKILEIYAPYVLATPISFEIEVPSVREFQDRISEKIGKFPWLVYEQDGAILGYACIGPFETRSAYSWTVESTIYVKEGFHRSGIGQNLYRELLGIAESRGFVNVIGGITLPNEASVRLHESFGFFNVAQIKDAGFKMGQWWDVGYWQLQFSKPQIPKPLSMSSLSLDLG